MPYKKYVSKGARVGGLAVKKFAKYRYTRKNKQGKTRPNFANIVSDVMLLKSMVNAEKKRKIVSNTQQALGQVNGNSSGHYMLDLTPVLNQGTGTANRTGASVKWHSSHLNFFMQPQANVVKRQQATIYVVKVVGQPFTTLTDILGKFLLSNQFITDQAIYDTVSERDEDYFKNFRVIRKKNVVFNPSFSGELEPKNVKMGFKLKNHHIKWNDDSATVASGQIILMIVLNTGNASGATTNTSASGGVYTQGISTGINFSYQHTHYFYDN